MLKQGKIFKSALCTVVAGAMIVYMGNSYINYQANYGSTTIAVLPEEIRKWIWIAVGLIVFLSIIPKKGVSFKRKG